MFTLLPGDKVIFKIKNEYLWLYTLFLSFEYVLVIYFFKKLTENWIDLKQQSFCYFHWFL